MDRKESKYTQTLQGLGFVKKKVSGVYDQTLLAFLQRLDCGIFMIIRGSTNMTLATDETGQDWQHNNEAIDLSEFGFRSVFSIGNEPEFVGEKKVLASRTTH